MDSLLQRRVAAESGGTEPPPARRVRGSLMQLLDGAGWVWLRVACDLLAAIVGCVVGLSVAPHHAGAWLLVAFPPLTVALLHARGRYVVGSRDLVLDNVAPGFGALSVAAMTIFTGQFLVSGGHDVIGSAMVWTWLTSLAGVTVAGLALPVLRQMTRRRRLIASPTLIVGTDITALDIALRLARRPEYGLKLVGFLSDARATVSEQLPPVLGGLEDLERVATTHGVRTVVVGYPNASDEEMLRFVARCDKLKMQTNVVPRLSSVVNYQTRFEYLGTVPLLNLRAINPESWSFAVKHAIDRVVAGLLLVALSPLLVVLGLSVRLSSPGPILFRQLRAGRDGRLFNLVKFRTMRAAPDDAADHKPKPGIAPGGVEGVDRRTTVGRILRRTSLDELPQLINVVRGEMSLVGPRPERPEFAELFRRDLERYQDRHRVRSGITGWAQVHSLRGQTSLVDRIEFDNFYIEHWSLSLDLKIVLLTIPALLRGS